MMGTLEAESATLLGEIINFYSAKGTANDVIVGVWNALPRAKFLSLNEFVELSGNAIRGFWRPIWSDAIWEDQIREPWQRLLVRLFVAGSVIASSRSAGGQRAYSPDDMADLRDVLIMATRSSAVAYVMLQDRFGPDLDSPYNASAVIRLMPGAAG